jgi:hypothetical protein
VPLCSSASVRQTQEHKHPICLSCLNHPFFHSSLLSFTLAPAPHAPAVPELLQRSPPQLIQRSAGFTPPCTGHAWPAQPHHGPGEVFSPPPQLLHPPPPQLLQRSAGFAPPSPGSARTALPRPARPHPAHPSQRRPARQLGPRSLPPPLCSSARALAGAAPPVRPGLDLSCHCCARPPGLWSAPPGPCTGRPGIGSPDPGSFY